MVDASTQMHGVTLEQYAGVVTALADELPLAEVVANEELGIDAWPVAQVAWTTAIAKDGAGGPLLTALVEKRAIAEDTLSRAIEPLDEELEAWMSFLNAYGTHAAPFEMLVSFGLRLNDVSRLQRRWSRRFAADAQWADRAEKIRRDGLAPLPRLRVAPCVLKPFPWSRRRGAADIADARAAAEKAANDERLRAASGAALASTSAAPNMVRLFSYVVIKAQLAENPGNERSVLEKAGIKDFAAVDASWQEMLHADPSLDRDYRTLLATQRSKIQRAKLQARQPDPTPASAASVVQAAPVVIVNVRPIVKNPELSGTTNGLSLPVLPALPFASAAPKPPTAASGAALPFEARSPATLPRPRPPRELSGTTDALPVPRTAALPFAASALAAKVHRESRNKALAGTSLVVDAPAKAALPFASLPAPPAPPSPATPAARAPTLSLEQHASLTVELAEAPDHTREVLERYRVTHEQKSSDDALYADRRARDDAARQAWDAAYETYRTWFRARGTPAAT